MHGISPYIFKVTDLEGVSQDLWNIQGISFLEYLKEGYFRDIFDVSRITQQAMPGVIGKNYILDEIYESTSDSACGRFSTGEFGVEAPILDVQQKIYTGKREFHESTMLPFYFGFYTPNSSNILERMLGILLLSRFNKYGIRSIVLPHLVTHFESAYPGLQLKVEKIVPTSFVNAVISKSEIKKIRLSTNKLPESYRGVLTKEDFDNVYEVETVIKPKPRSFFSKPGWVSSMAKGVPLNTIISLPDVEISRLKIEVSTGKGRTRTINVANVDRMAANIEITNPVTTGGNHILKDCWFEEADILADDCFLELGLKIPEWKNDVTLIKYDRGTIDQNDQKIATQAEAVAV